MKTMDLAGLDTPCYKAYTFRGALPSRLSSVGASAHTIIEQGDWSWIATFNRFYNRVVDESPAGLLVREVMGRRNK